MASLSDYNGNDTFYDTEHAFIKKEEVYKNKLTIQFMYAFN